MKAFKSLKPSALTFSMLALAVMISTANAQEYDDMYFNKADRKTVKHNTPTVANKSIDNSNYKEISESTETYSAKNINPEYIARYKSPEANQEASYSDKDYFVEGYDDEYVSDSDRGNIDYDALAKRDQMSASNHNNSFSNSSWRFRPSMSMGFGSPYYGGYGYDPFMMGYGSGLSMSFGFGSGFGFPSSAMAMSIGMSWGSGYNSWGGGYPGYYSPYGMRSYSPWDMYGYRPYGRHGYSPYYGGGYGGYYPSTVIINNSDYNGGNVSYKPRSNRASVNQSSANPNRGSSSTSNIRVPKNSTDSPASNGRVSRDYSKAQNEYYNSNRARRNSSSVQRIATTEPHRRSSGSSSRYKSSISNNKPSRVSNYSSGSNRSSSYSKYSNSGTNRSSSSSSSYSTPSRSSSSYSSGNSGSRSSSYSSGSSSRTSSGSRSSSSSRSSR